MNCWSRIVCLSLILAPVVANAQLLGKDDFLISNIDPAGSDLFGAGNAAIAYNSSNNEFLVVWAGDDDSGAMVAGEQEIFARRVSESGMLLSDQTRISFMGPDGAVQYAAFEPKVAYNPLANQYLVIWWGDVPDGALVDKEDEVYGQILTATLVPVGSRFRISFMGTDGDVLAGATSPDVVFNPTANEYYAIWQGDNINGIFADQDFEIWGQRINAPNGNLIGSNTRLSDMGSTDGDASFTAADCRVAYNSTDNEYFVVWEGDDDNNALNGDMEIYGQRVNASTGAEIGNDIRLTFHGDEDRIDEDATNPSLAYNPTDNQYLLAYNATVDGLNDFEIYTRLLNAAGQGLKAHIRLSQTGGTAQWALRPDVVFSPDNDLYAVTWRAEFNNNEYEIYVQNVGLGGEPLPPSDLRISDMGPDGSSFYDAGIPAIAANSDGTRTLIVWAGNDDRPELADDDYEVFGRFIGLHILFSSGFEPLP